MARRALCLAAAAIAVNAAVSSAATEPIVSGQTTPLLNNDASTLLSSRMQDQISLSLTANAGEMGVTWITYEPYRPSFSGSVSYWADTLRKATAAATTWTYTVEENAGWNGTIYFATMTGLSPETQYTYTLNGNGLTTAPRNFTTPPVSGPDAHTLFAVTADFGTVELSGFLVAAEIIREQCVALALRVRRVLVTPPLL